MQRTHLVVLLIGIAMVTMTVPAGAAAEDPLRERNRAWLMSQVDTWEPDAEATVYTGQGPQVVTTEAAMAGLLDRLDSVELDLAEAFGGSPTPDSHSHGPANHTAGDFGLFESNTDPEINCSQGGGGAGGHYDQAVEVGSHGTTVLGIPVGTYDYVGTATSRVSLGDGARAILFPVTSIELGIIGASIPGSQGYADEVRYEGTSDFHCIEFSFIPGFTVNAPLVRGTFGPTPDSPEGPV